MVRMRESAVLPGSWCIHGCDGCCEDLRQDSDRHEEEVFQRVADRDCSLPIRVGDDGITDCLQDGDSGADILPQEEDARWSGRCELCRLKQPGEENSKWRQLEANLSLEKKMLQHLSSKKSHPQRRVPEAAVNSKTTRLPHSAFQEKA